MKVLHRILRIHFILVTWAELTFQVDLDHCNEFLGVKDGRIIDSSLSASSSYDYASVGPQNARLHSDSGGGAWCPSNAVSHDTSDNEYLEIDLGSLHIVTGILSQGRFGNGRGQEYAEAYKIHYFRQGMTVFREYRDSLGQTILPGNIDTYSVANNTLKPSIFAEKIRLLPYSEHPRTVCMRVEILGCPFTEGVTAYSIPQGMVRGSILELMDHTYDGQEDSATGELSGGLGQLVDGRYGDDNFKATGRNGHVKGYDWIGWKKKPNSNILKMMFNFDAVRTFQRIDIHTNNHFTKDISVFSSAKIYFSNEEGKFADDRVVDFKYMPDLSLENARNVSINLHGEHGQYLMIHLTFEKKWILISEITFISKLKEQTLFTVVPPQLDVEITRNYGHDVTTAKPDRQEEEPSDRIGVLIGILITFIALLLAGIVYVTYRSKQKRSTHKPTYAHPILSAKFTDRHPIDYYATPMDLHRGPITTNTTTTSTQDTIYEEPTALYSASGFLSLNRKSTDHSDDYADPDKCLLTSSSTMMNNNNKQPPVTLPINHYARPLSPTQRAVAISTSTNTTATMTTRPSHTGSLSIFGSKKLDPASRVRSETKFITTSPSSSSSSCSSASCTSSSRTIMAEETNFYASVRIPDTLYAQITNKNDLGTLMSPRPEVASDTDLSDVELSEINPAELKSLEKLGEGQFGEIHLCVWKNKLVAVKSLKAGCDQSTKSDFEREARILTTLTDPNLVRVLGVSFRTGSSYQMICEYADRGDLYQFLQDHVAETTLSKSPSVPTLSYGCLIYLATQIASGMKYLESLNFVHRDLATRNCLVGLYPEGLTLKISDFGMSRPIYKNDYYQSQNGCLLPIRWMAWESVLMGKFTTQSDVWSFAVTLWEILTFAREQPFESLSDDKVIASLSSVYQHGRPLTSLPAPFQCPREVRDLMAECWQRDENERPSFREIHLFLQRKNLGYNPMHEAMMLSKFKQNNNFKHGPLSNS